MGVVVFNYAEWALQFPALATQVSPELAQLYFDRRCPFYLDNTDGSVVTDVNQRSALLDLLVAHIAMVSGASPAAAQGVVGRISSVTEGSVTIKAESPTGNSASALAAWFGQTGPGAQFWAMTAPYRTFQYVPGPEPLFEAPRPSRWR